MENNKNGSMKTTLELPDALFREIKLRAVNKGQKLKETVAELLQKGLASDEPRPLAPAVIGRDPRTGLPVIMTQHAAAPGEEMTAERIAQILLDQEVAWHHEAG
jgi:plasmid stability protein